LCVDGFSFNCFQNPLSHSCQRSFTAWLLEQLQQAVYDPANLFEKAASDVYISVHRKKKVREFPVLSQDVTTKLSLGGNNDVITDLFLPKGSLVSDIPAGDGKLVNLFLLCEFFLLP
jgi:hypothetical protein